MAQGLGALSGVVAEGPEVITGLSPLEIDIQAPALALSPDGAMMTEMDDGSVEIDFSPNEGLQGPNPAAEEHDANLASYIAEAALATIAEDLIQAIEEDIKSNEDWTKSYLRGIDLLGMKVIEKTKPFKGACSVTDPLLMEGVLRFQSTASGEMLPASGPVKAQIPGDETPELVAQGNRQSQFLNYYLTEEAEEYYDQYDNMLMWLPVCGSIFKKVYQDPQFNRPMAPFITPDYFIVNYATENLATSTRYTHVVPTNKRDMKWRQLMGYYRTVELGEPVEPTLSSEAREAIDKAQGIKKPMLPADDRYTVYESYADLDIPGFEHSYDGLKPSGFPLPYRVSIEKTSRKVLEIRRNWREGDQHFRRKQYFVHYRFFPGLGFYGLGLSHVLGGQVKAATMLLQQLTDAGTLHNFPGGVRVKGMKIENNDLIIGPNQFPEIDTGGLPIQQALMTMPYKEPSVVLQGLRAEIVEGGRRLINATEIAVGDGRQDAPVGTTLALLEQATKIESGVLKRCHRAQRRELKLFVQCFRDHLEPNARYPFMIEGGAGMLMLPDFDDRVDVIPVSDPNAGTSSQRLLKAEGLLRLAQAAPQIHDLREAYRRVYQEMRVSNIDKVLPPPAEVMPMDPMSENQRALTGQPIKVGPWQDDGAHIEAHQPFMDAPGMQAHVGEHLASKYWKLIQMTLGIELPPLGTQLPPEIENQIAVLVARATKIIDMENEIEKGPTNPLKVAMEEIKVDALRVQASLEAARMVASTKAYEVNKRQQTDREKMRSTERIAQMKVISDTTKPQGEGGSNRPVPQALAPYLRNGGRLPMKAN